MSTTPRPAVERFLEKVDKTDSCWLWTGATSNGYGQFQSLDPELPSRWAHRYSYEYHVGPIPDGLVIDHLCRNRGCVNPDHLEVVTMAENIRRIPRPTHCPHGHEFTPENTGRSTEGGRRCRTCLRERTRAYRAARKAVSA